MRAVLPKPNRLRRRADFVRVTRTGRRCTRGTLTAYLLQASPATGDGTTQPQVGLVVSRAIGGAVVRNAVTRRLRAVAAERLDRLPVGACVVLRANPAAAGADVGALGADLDACLDRLLPAEAVAP